MAEPTTCPVMTHPGSNYVDPEPPEYCENPVPEGQDHCDDHEPADEPDWDSIRKDRELDDRYGN